ncbi:MAG: DUF131 domain-containing protein [Archaeoglobaceae archaeon]|nr:DUF131 domain-containing protein [Archaeoglobaceae archaeon]
MDAGKLFLGFALVIIGLTLVSVSRISHTSYGAIVILGPLPVIVASELGIAIFLLILASILLLILYIFWWLR